MLLLVERPLCVVCAWVDCNGRRNAIQIFSHPFFLPSFHSLILCLSPLSTPLSLVVSHLFLLLSVFSLTLVSKVCLSICLSVCLSLSLFPLRWVGTLELEALFMHKEVTRASTSMLIFHSLLLDQPNTFDPELVSTRKHNDLNKCF